jgi:serine/threonine protein kinase
MFVAKCTYTLQIRNEKARRYLSSMRRKKPIPFTQKFPNADPFALNLLERMLAFDPKDRPSAEEVVLVPQFFSYVLLSL